MLLVHFKKTFPPILLGNSFYWLPFHFESSFWKLPGYSLIPTQVNKVDSKMVNTLLMHPCSQQTFRFIKNGHLQFFVYQKVWYIGVTKSIKLKKFFVRFLFYGYWKFVTSQRWKKTQKLMKIEKLLNETVWKRWKSSEFCI